MFTPDQSDFRLTELMRRASQQASRPATDNAELAQAREDIQHLLVLIDDLDEQLTDALNGSWDYE